MANTHQIAHRLAPEARVAYADIDPMVSTHAAALMAGPLVVTLKADPTSTTRYAVTAQMTTMNP
jgi:hypothetical protein